MGNGAGSVATYLEMSVDLIGCEDSGDAHITLDDVSCGAGATSLSDCTSTTSENCACSEGIIVGCDEEETTEAPGVGLWLDDNNQVRYNEGYVCDDGFYQESADMVCKVVNGAGSVATYLETSVDLIGCDSDNESDAHITLDSVDCGAEAMSLSDCSYSDDYEDCSCGEGIIVECGEETTEAPGLGLWLDGMDQVRYDDGFVCDDSFSQESADMVCAVVNGAGSVATYLEMSVDLIGCEDSGDAHITLDSVDCGAEAMSLSDFSYSDDYEDCSCGEGII